MFSYFQLENRQLCVESLMLSTLNKKKTVLDQLLKGRKALDVLDNIRKKPVLFEPLFISSPTEDLTHARMMSVLFFQDDEALSKEHLLRFIGDSSKSGMSLNNITKGWWPLNLMAIHFVPKFPSICGKKLWRCPCI